MCNERVVGICSECGGTVTVPTVWYGIYPPSPTCNSCGATADIKSNLPVIPMKPNKWRTPWIDDKSGSNEPYRYVAPKTDIFDMTPQIRFTCSVAS